MGKEQKDVIPAVILGNKNMARALAIYSATVFITEKMKTFTSWKPSDEDVMKSAKKLIDFIEND